MRFATWRSINFNPRLETDSILKNMEAYKLFQQKRKTKQLLTALVFIVILAFGWQYPLLGYFIPLCMLLGIGFGLARGRTWCNWYCPRGSFYDVLISAVSPKRKIPALAKNLFFRIGVLVVLLTVMTYNVAKRWPDPYRMGMFLVSTVTVTTVIGIILALIFHQRTWCMICPIGTMTNLIGRNRYPLKINSDLCVECRLCAKVCPVQIKPYLYKGEGMQVVKDGDCLKCGLCVAACPKKALHLLKPKKNRL